MNSCKSFNILITKHLDGNISKKEQEQLMKHVSCCDLCKDEYEKYNLILDVLNEKNEIEPPETFEREVMQQIWHIDIYKKKSKEKKLLKLYFATSMIFTLMFILLGTAFKEQILSIMLYINLPSQYAYGIYNFLELSAVFLNIIKNLLIYLCIYISEVYFILIGLGVLAFLSKAYQPKNKNSKTVELFQK
ncbi:MAG: hypothetical protein GX387_03985 [Clostridium sp.]|nr:hypothetical protein [Clostridium sp.]